MMAYLDVRNKVPNPYKTISNIRVLMFKYIFCITKVRLNADILNADILNADIIIKFIVGLCIQSTGVRQTQ